MISKLQTQSFTPRQRLLCRLTLILIASFVCHGLMPRMAVAQRDDAAKDIAKGLLRALIESQLQKQNRGNLPPGGPRQPHPPRIDSNARPAQPTREYQQLRTLLATMEQESNTLTELLNNDSRRNPEVRSRLADVVGFQASVTAARQHADEHHNHTHMQPTGQLLDQAWKPLAYQLATLSGIGQQTRESIERMNQMDAQLCGLLGIQEQFNSRELIRAADLLVADLRTLSEDIGYAGATGVNRTRLSGNIRRHEQKASSFANLAASGAQFQNVVAEYQNLHQTWQGLRPELDQYAARNLTRTVGRIEDSHRTIHQLLRLQYRFDEPFVKRMAEGIDRDVAELLRTITLEQMLTLPDNRSLLVAADALQGNCQNLSDVIARHEPLQQVGEAWMYLDQQWQLFAYYLNPVHAAETRRRVDGIAQSLQLLKNAIGVSVGYDYNAVRQQATAVDSLADLLQTTCRRWLKRPGQQNAALEAELQKLANSCRQLTTVATTNRDPAAVLPACDAVIGLWQQVRPQLTLCQTQERESLDQAIADFTPALLHLRTMLGE